MKRFLSKVKEYLFNGFLAFTCVWIVSALLFQSFFIYLHFTNQDNRAQAYSNEIMWRIDGTFKNDPRNIWYEGK